MAQPPNLTKSSGSSPAAHFRRVPEQLRPQLQHPSELRSTGVSEAERIEALEKLGFEWEGRRQKDGDGDVELSWALGVSDAPPLECAGHGKTELASWPEKQRQTWREGQLRIRAMMRLDNLGIPFEERDLKWERPSPLSLWLSKQKSALERGALDARKADRLETLLEGG